MSESPSTLEELHGSLVLLGGGPACERAQVTSPPGPRVHFPGIQTVLAGLELADHADLLTSQLLCP